MLNEGAQKIGIVGLPPIGCLPGIITLNSNAFHQRECVETLSSIARDYNQMLQKESKALQNGRTQIFYADIDQPLRDMIQWHTSFGKHRVGSSFFLSFFWFND